MTATWHFVWTYKIVALRAISNESYGLWVIKISTDLCIHSLWKWFIWVRNFDNSRNCDCEGRRYVENITDYLNMLLLGSNLKKSNVKVISSYKRWNLPEGECDTEGYTSLQVKKPDTLGQRTEFPQQHCLYINVCMCMCIPSTHIQRHTVMWYEVTSIVYLL